MGLIGAEAFNNINQVLLPYATDTSLDQIGSIFGVTRIQQQTAYSDSSDGNFYFYVRTGTFGDINSGNDIAIPDNIQIFTQDPSGPVYVANAVTLLAGNSQQYFSATSLLPGSSGNASSAIFTRHNFTNYTQSPFGGLLVTNTYGITAGRDTEDDDSYRYRIHLKLSSQSGINEAALRFQLLQLPGIQDVVFSSYAGGFYVYLYGISPVVSPSLLQLANSTLATAAAFPLQATALSPDLVGFSFSTTLSFNSGVSQSDQASILATASAAAANYINNLAVGAPLVINQLASAILTSDNRIQDIGDPNDEIARIFIWGDGPMGRAFRVSADRKRPPGNALPRQASDIFL